MKKFWIGLAVGVLVGGAAVLLYAPQSGSSTRRKLKRSMEDLGDNLGDDAEYLKEQAERLGKEAQRFIGNSKEEFGDTFESVQHHLKSATAEVRGKASRIM